MPIIRTPPIQGSPPPISSAFLRDFTGGINFAADDIQVPKNQFSDALDIDPDVKGGFVRRNSFRSLGVSGLSSSASPKLLFHFPETPVVTSDGWVLAGGQSTTPHDVLTYWYDPAIVDGGAATATRTFTADSTLGRTWSAAMMDRVTGTSDLNVYIHRDYLSAVQSFQSDGNLHGPMTNAYGNYHDDLAAPTGGTMPFASIMCAHQNYMFHADCYENSIRRRNRIRWSHPGQPGDYRTNDYIDVGEGQDNSEIRALVSAQGRLFIFKDKSVWVLSGFSAETFSLVRIVEGAGAVNKNAACAVMDGVVFFDTMLGVQKIKPSTGSTWVVEDLWSNLSRALEDTRLTNQLGVTVCAVGTKIAVSGLKWKSATNPNRTFVYDSNVGNGWWVYSVGFELLCRFTGSAGRNYIMGAAPFTNEGGASTTYRNYVSQQTHLSTSVQDRLNTTTPIDYNGYLFTSWVDAGDPARKKRFRRFSLTFDGMPTNKSFTVNGYRNWSVDIPPVRTFTVAGLGNPTAGNAGQQNNVRGGALGTAYSAALLITGPNDVAWGINQVTFRFVPKRVT